MADHKDEFSRMSELAFGKKLIKEEKKASNKKQLDEHALGIVGVPAINKIIEREKTNYELAFEHFLGERYEEEDENVTEVSRDEIFNRKELLIDKILRDKYGKEGIEASLTPEMKAIKTKLEKLSLPQLSNIWNDLLESKTGSSEDITDKFTKAVKGDKKPKGKNTLKEEFSLDQLLLRIKANVKEFLARGGDLEALEGILKMSVKSYE